MAKYSNPQPWYALQDLPKLERNANGNAIRGALVLCARCDSWTKPANMSAELMPGTTQKICVHCAEDFE